MGYYHLDLDQLAAFTGRPIEDLKNESYASLEAMIKDMEHEKFIKQNRKNAQDAEYERLVLKYFEPRELLGHWFDDKEIVLSCAGTGITERDLCQEINVEPGSRCWYTNAEYIRTSVESVRQFDKQGRELMESARMKRDVYRVANKYQSLHHGQVVLDLLYGRYPELAKFGFTAYGMSCGEQDYEIYPKNDIYTSLTALLSGDVDWILHRNWEYCKWYNNGRYSEAECEKAFRTKEAQEMFDIIQGIGEKERALGHMPFTVLESGAIITAQHLITTRVSDSGNVTLLMKKDQSRTDKNCFKLATAAPYTVERMVAEFLGMTNGAKIILHVAHKSDHLMEHSIEVPNVLNPSIDPRVDGHIVYDSFGWMQNGVCDLTLRVDCPQLMN